MKAVNRFTRSSSFFMASLFSAFLLGLVAVALYLIISAGNKTLLHSVEAEILQDISLLESVYTNDGLEPLIEIMTQLSENASERSIYLMQSESNQFSGQNFIGFLPQDDVFEVEKFIEFTDQNEAAFLGYAIDFDEKLYVLIARDITKIKTAKTLAFVFSIVILVTAFLLGAGFFLIGRFVVDRVNHISKTASNIMQTGNMSERIKNESTWDDLGKLTNVLNLMLEEIETLIKNTKRVTDNIAHDLRTPLTNLRNELEEVSDDTQREELLKEADSLLAMFNGLLRLAEIETENKKTAFAQINLSEIVKDVEEFYLPLADEKNVSINTLIENLGFYGDRNLLFQAFANIIDNAIKFTPRGKSIDITLKKHKEHILFSVQDSGPGIPETEHSNIFQRMYREDKSRHTKGHGLGLSIVKAVVELHEGEILLRTAPRGLIFMITFKI